MEQEKVHESVLKEEVMQALDGLDIKVFIDATLGAGGHAREVIKRCFMPESILVGFDRDSQILEIAKRNLLAFKEQCHIFNRCSNQILKTLTDIGLSKVDAFLMDLGVSSFQLDTADRGFSFRKNGPLDMRMDSYQEKTAYEIVNTYSMDDLVKIFREFGEVKNAKFAARKIVQYREKKLFQTTDDLASLFEIKGFRARGKKHGATQIFQAIRIEVNQELSILKESLVQAFKVLKRKGRLLVISFHSLEDRIVKRFFNELTTGCECPPNIPVCVCSKKPQAKLFFKGVKSPSEQELKKNIRSRSAKLRVIEKL